MTQIQFILGRGGTGKTSWCVAAAAEALAGSSDTPLVLLVPEQATYQMEHAVLSRPGVAGYSRLRVLSFNRLVFWLNRRLRSGAELSRLGRQMATHRVLLELAEELGLYREAARQPGLAQRLSGLLTELQQADCGPEQIAALARQLGTENPGHTTTRKWQDIAKVFAGYTAFFEGSSCGLRNPDVQLTLARREIEQATFLKGAQVWVDGFSGFTVQERELLIAMARQAETMHIALCLDPTTFDLAITDANLLDPSGLFYSTEQTYAELSGIFGKCNFSMAAPVLLNEPRRYATSPGLGHIEAHLMDDELTEMESANGAVEIACCVDARAEAEWAAGRICELVRGKGYRYRQIAVAVPEMDVYAAVLESAFKGYGIPFFLDRPAAMRHHPLAETLQAGLAAADGFATADVLCYLKSGLAGVEPGLIDRLERYCLAYGVEREDWTETTVWRFGQTTAPEEDAVMEGLRRRVVGPLKELQTSVFIQKEGLEAGAFVRSIWAFLECLEARKTLAAWAQDDPADMQGHRQTWTQLMGVLDELERVFAGRTEQASTFVSVLTDALSSLTIKLIPPTLDQVLIGSIERSRHPEVRAMFLVGATQKQFPVPLSTTDVLGRREREAAREQGLELADTLSQQLSMRQYLAYIALTRASEYLAISFPQQDEKGAATVPSVWVERVELLFDDVSRSAAGRGQTVWQSRSAGELAERLAAACGKDRHAGSQTDAAAYVLCAGMGSALEPVRAAAEHVMGALTYENAAVLAAEAAAKMKLIANFSATRLGAFAACPYQHFAKYVLGLEKRPILRFEPVDVGVFYHKVIETLFMRLKERGLSWGTAAADELAALCEATIGRTLAENETIAAFMRRQMHPRYIIEGACETVRRFVPALAELERAGVFRQAASEFDFAFELDKGVRLKGRIDRVDIAEVGGQTAAVIFDYKRTPRPVSWTDLYYGLDVQLLMYLLAVPSLPKALNARHIAGAFYVPIEISGKTLWPDEIEEKRAGFGYKAKGIFNGEFAAAIDTAASGRSRYYNFAVSKDGQPYSYYGNSGAVRPEEFAVALAYGRTIIGRLAGDIRSGCITAAPYRIGKASPCGHCDYKSVCRFDWQINDYNILESCGKEEALEKMKEEKI